MKMKISKYSFLSRFLPDISQVVSVYGVIAIIIYNWSVYWFFWKLSSWVKYLQIGEIIEILSYVLVMEFIESLLILCIPLSLSIILPHSWFKDFFVVRGTICIVSILAYFIFLSSQLQSISDFSQDLFKTIPFLGGIIFILIFASTKIKIVYKMIEGFSNRASLFGYITLPIILAAVFVMIISNFFG